MDSDISIQSADKTGTLGDLHLALVVSKEVAKERAQWRRSDVKDKIDAQTRMDPGASLVLGSGGPALYAWVAEECNRILGQALTEYAERAHEDLAQRQR